MSKYTPGPWELRIRTVGIWLGCKDVGEYVRTTTGKEIVSGLGYAKLLPEDATSKIENDFRAIGHKTYREGEEFPHTPNARLIAAAPEMAEALEAALECLETNGFAKAYTIDVIRAALKKAGVLS